MMELKDVGSQHAEKFNRTIRPLTRSLTINHGNGNWKNKILKPIYIFSCWKID